LVVEVNSSAALMAAITKAHDGDTIQVAPGEYTLSKLQNLSFANGVTVVSADPLHPAVVDGLNLQNVSGLTFNNLEVKVDEKVGAAVVLNIGSRDNFENLNIHGSAVGDGGGITVRSATNVTLSNLNVHDLSGGINILNTNTVSVVNSQIHDIAVDGIQTSGSSHVTISGNAFTNFFPSATAHSDAIQFYTAGTTSAAHDITITNNTYVRGAGEADTQGIFLGDEAKVGYENVTISGNTIVGGLYQGIAIAGADNLTLTHNIVEGYTDQTSWILLSGDSNGFETDNVSTSYNAGAPSTNIFASNNTIIPLARVGDVSILGGGDANQAVIVEPAQPIVLHIFDSGFEF
jgi:parallel beta-helix repeat protein